ncbi:MAG: hypothetical protein C5B51_22095 [Terriglobia bacterium]|nr:MAG: hypothetical protein C5B51_22095 [Terriglobia bacterium]
MRRVSRLFVAVLIGVGLGMLIVTDNALHPARQLAPAPRAADYVARNTASSWEPGQVTTSDGVTLHAWYFAPLKPNGSVVIALHGVGDTRLGMLSHATFLLTDGFTVLLPDLRGHGESGGAIVTYGIKEAGDVRYWVDWLFQKRGTARLYGIGQSLGAAVLLQSLSTEKRFRAVVADSPFATFEEISYDRLGQISRIPPLTFWPLIRLGFIYAQLRYGLDLRQASPSVAIRATSVPVLLIHGARDTNIPLRHSEELHAANPNGTQLWVVSGAEHVASLATSPERYISNVIRWFNSHQ